VLTPDLPAKADTLIVDPQEMRVVLADEGTELLSLVLPPLEDLQEIEELKSSHRSIREQSFAIQERLGVQYVHEYDRLKEKFDRFKKSETFLNRLATLAAAAGDRPEEGHLLDLAMQRTDDPFFAHRLGDSLIAQRRSAQAEKLFEKLDLTSDVYANLRMAYFHVQKSCLDLATEHVRAAVDIDPLNFAARLFEGGLALAKGDYDGAIHSFRRAAEERPTSSVVFGNMAIAYIRLKRFDKALSILKRAVALDPLNEVAVFLLADLGFMMKRDDEAIPALRYYVLLEQKEVGAWARLARAAMRIGNPAEAVSALKRQASVNASSAVWNNLGVAYTQLNDRVRALQAFKHAMQFGEKDRDFFLAARNLAQMISRHVKSDELLKFTETVIESDTRHTIPTDPALSDIYIFYIHALSLKGRWEKAIAASEELLTSSRTSRSLLAWVVTMLIGRYALYEDTPHKSLDLIDSRRALIGDLVQTSAAWRDMLLNNVAFALAEYGRVDESEKYLQGISDAVHREPYPTATLGLIQMRKGNIERAIQLYQEAIGKALANSDRIRIRQKMNLELGRYWSRLDFAKARQCFERVLKIRGGEEALSNQASKDLAALS
jgi:tetratricopeptide (TPR) repeat protein